MNKLRALCALTAASVVAGPAAPVLADTLWISGGTPVTTIPQGTSGHSVLGPAGIGFAGGQIWVDGRLDNLGEVTLTLYDVGSESHWMNFLLLENTSGPQLRDMDDHYRGTTGNFVNGPAPFQLTGSVIQHAGLTDMRFTRLVDLDPEELVTVVNGQSPMMNVPGYSYASIALAYLNAANQIVSTPTDRVLVMLEDGGADRDYDDYVGILDTGPIGAVSQFTLAPTTVDFGSVMSGTTSQSKTILVQNSGSVALPISSITVGGNNKYQFSLTHSCPSVLPVGAVCPLSVVFVPTGTGAKTALAVIKAGAAVEKTVQLRGTATAGVPAAAPAYSVTPATLDFGAVANGTSSPAKSFVVQNTGSLALPIASIALAGTDANQFFQTHNCPVSLPVGGTCAVSVVFSPTSLGEKTALAVVLTGGGAADKSVQLRGAPSAIVLDYSVAPIDLDFGSVPNGTSGAAKSFVVQNTGNVSLQILSIAVAGADGNQFSQTHNCPAELPAGSNCTVSVVFSPTFAGDKSALVIVQGGNGAPEKSVQLRGTSTVVAPPAAPDFSVSPATLQFGNVPSGTTSAQQTFLVRNTGGIAISILSVAVGGNNKYQFSLTHDCPASLPVGASCTASVVFIPTSAGAKTALGVVKAGGGVPEKSTQLRGTGT